jgi:hypothetical protein
MSNLSWIPVGNDIPGEASGDQSGRSVALSSDGNRVAIGAAYNNDGGADSGHARVLDWNGTEWIRVGLDIPGKAAGDELGWSIAISSDGNRVAIGSKKNSDGGSQSGHVRVRDWNGTEWVHVGIDIPGEAAGDESGGSVAMSSDGNKIAIGAKQNDGGGDNSGNVRVWEWNGVEWIPVGIDIPGVSKNDESGNSVALSSDGSRVAIGAIGNDGGGDNSGHVRVFGWDGSIWNPVGIAIPGESAGDQIGNSVVLSSDGSRVAISSKRNDDGGDKSGHVRVFDWNGSVWEPVGFAIPGESAGDESGNSLAISSDGSRVAIGAKNNNDGGDTAGHVRIFDWNGSEWVPVGFDIDSNSAGDELGHSVAMSSDGNRIAIGAIQVDGGINTGFVRVLDLNMSNTQDQSSSSFNAGPGDDEYFASSTEEIKLGRESVTELATEPPHVFDVVWNMDLNTALASIYAPYIIDASEAEHKDGATAGTKMYTLGTSSNTIEIEAVQTLTGDDVTQLTYTHTDSNTRVGTGATESICMGNLANQLQTDGSTVTLLAADGSQDVGSSIAVLMSAAASSSVGNSLEVGNQTATITDFMTQLKSAAGTYEWYSNLTNNDRSVTTQTRNGLAQLFDRSPQLNNIIGSAATSSAFLDASKIQAKLQLSSDEFYTKYFSDTQLREVLEAVADRGTRITGTGANRKFNFTAGDSITAVVKVTDTDSDSQNTDRWLITLQQTA